MIAWSSSFEYERFISFFSLFLLVGTSSDNNIKDNHQLTPALVALGKGGAHGLVFVVMIDPMCHSSLSFAVL